MELLSELKHSFLSEVRAKDVEASSTSAGFH